MSTAQEITAYRPLCLKATPNYLEDESGRNTMVPTMFDGWDQHFTLLNRTDDTLFIYTSSGKFLRKVPPCANSLAVTDTLQQRGVLLVWETLTEQASSGKRNPLREMTSHLLHSSELSDRPILVEELGIVIATALTKDMVKSASALLDDLMCRRTLMIKDGEYVEPLTMVVYGNFDTKKYPNFYLGIDDTVIRVCTQHCELFEEGHGLMFLDQSDPDGTYKRLTFHLNFATLLTDPDGVMTYLTADRQSLDDVPRKANYVLSYSHDLVTAFVRAQRDDYATYRTDRERSDIEKIARQDIEQEVAQRISVATTQLRSERDTLESTVVHQAEEIDGFKKQVADLSRDKKRLLTLVEEGRDPEAIDEHIRAKAEERALIVQEKELSQKKAKLEMTKQTVGIAAGAASLAAMFAGPIKSFFAWLGSKLGFLGMALA